eukprot:6463836-Amphidinium_carterae.2
MILQEWYDDNEQYDAYELKTAIKEEHDALQKTGLRSTTIERHYPDKMGNTFQTRWKDEKTQSTICSKRLHTPKVNIGEIYAATPGAITLRMLLTLAQLRNNHSI